MKNKEQLVSIFITGDVTVVNHQELILAGKVKRVVSFYNNENNKGNVRLAIKDTAKNEISPLQNIKSYRTRDGVMYENDGKNLSLEGGRSYYFNVVADTVFADDTIIDLLLIFEEE